MLLAACGDDEGAGCPEGTEGCACYGGELCLGDLECQDDVCVDPSRTDGGEPGLDASAAPDAGPSDAGSDPPADGAVGEDGGMDAGPAPTEDGGPESGVDAGPDSGHHDAGPICDDACDEHATCSFTEQGAACVCNAGYEGPGILCTDVDECSAGTDDCDANATCHNTPGGFTCTCNEYYFGPGRACAPIDPATFVRDVSNAPIAWEISGVGTFRAHGMSRLMWDIEVIETPATPPRVLKDAGAIRVPDVTLRGLEPVLPTTLDDLEAWAEDDMPRSATVTLRGLRGELLIADLYDVVPLTADTSQDGGKLRSVTLAVGSMGVNTATDYSAPQSASPPVPATFIELNGVTQDAAFLPADIDKLADGEHGSIELRKVPNHADQEQAAVLIDWMQSTIQYLNQQPPVIDRRSGSLIERTSPPPASEVSRVNCFEIWPHQLYLFNPAKSYPNAYLVDVAIAAEYCEDGR